METRVKPIPGETILDRYDKSRDAILGGKARGVEALDTYLLAQADFFRDHANTEDPSKRGSTLRTVAKIETILSGDIKQKEGYCLQSAKALAIGSENYTRLARENNNPRYLKDAQRNRNEAVAWLLLAASLYNNEEVQPEAA